MTIQWHFVPLGVVRSRLRAWFRCFITVLFLSVAVLSYGQSKVNITSKLPSEVDLCGENASVTINVRNITTGKVTSQECKLNLPSGLFYVKGSVSGTGVSEKSTTNLQYPEFTLPDLAITESVDIKIEVIADCGMESFLSTGGVPTISAVVSYTGGSVSHKSLPLTIQQPSINITSVTNQFYAADLKESFIRTITIKNGGKGSIKNFTIDQLLETGLKLWGRKGGTNSVSGDTFRTVFDSSHFKMIGNKDALFSYNEIVTLIDTVYVSDCKNLGAKILLNWGCNGDVCKKQTYSTQVTIKSKAPDLRFIPKGSYSKCFDPSEKSPQQLLIINEGDDTAREVRIDIFQSINGGFSNALYSQIDTSTLTYRVGKSGTLKKIKASSIKLNQKSNSYSCLGANPVGFVSLSLGAIEAGDSLYLDWNSSSCCVNTCLSSLYAHRWRYNGDYKDQCQKTISVPEAWGSVGYRHNLTFTSFTPTDINPGDTLKYTFNVTNAYIPNISSKSVIDVYMELPSGVTHSLKTFHFQFENHKGQSWQPTSVSLNGDSIHAQFKGSPKLALLGSELIVRLVGKCAQSAKNSNGTYNFYFNYTPDATCTNACSFQLACQSGPIRVHCDNSCTGGLKFGDFDAYRISYGLPDNDNDGEEDATGSLDMDKIKTERVMYGDTLLTVFRGRINRLGSITSWTKLTATSYFPYGKFLEVGDATIRILRKGNQLYKCSGIGSSQSTSGSNRTFTFDLGTSALISASCPLYSGFAYLPADSVELYVKYVVATNPGNFFREIQVSNSFYLHTATNPTPAQRYQCDTFSGKFMLAGSYFTNYGRGVYTTNGCNEFEVSQNYYLSIGNCCSNYAGGNLFPFEYRRWARPDKLILIKPPGFDVINTRFYDYRTTGTGSRTYQYEDTVGNMTQRGDTLFYDISNLFTDNGGNFKISDDGFYGFWYCKLRPNCAARNGVTRVQYGFDFQKFNYLGSGVERLFIASQNDDISYSAPELSISSLSDDINVDSDTAVWQIVINNASSVSLSKNLWLAGQYKGNSRVIEVVDVATSKPVPLSNDIFQLGDLNPGKSITLLVKATFVKCFRDSFNLYIGHDCETYPDSLASAKCITEYRKLFYTPQNTFLESFVEATDTVIDLCGFHPYNVTVGNLSNARAFNLYVDLFLQEGVELKDTAYLFLPGSTDSIMVRNVVYLGSGQYRWDISGASAYLDTNGLAGITSTNPHEYTLKFKLSTNCNFVSSTYFLARPGGNLRCGKSVRSGFSSSKPMDIKGIVKPYFSHLQFDKKAIDVCNYDGDGVMSFINLGPDTTGGNDYIQLLLPDGIYVDTTYMVGIRNTPVNNPTIKHGVKYTGVWKIPNGIVAGDSVVFRYKTYVNSSELECGTTQILAQSVVSQPALCVKDSTYCDIDVSTSSDIQLDSIKKGIYTLKVVDGYSKPQNGLESMTLTYTISNSGSKKVKDVPMPVKVVADTNGNGIADVGEDIVGRDTINIELPTAQVFTRTMQFDVASQYACNLLLVVDSTSCVCEQTTLSMLPFRIINAGSDTMGCSRTDLTVGLPPMTGATYTWLSKGIKYKDSSKTVFNWINTSKLDSTYHLLLETDRGECKTVDTVSVTLYPALLANFTDSIGICLGDRILIGDIPTGGVGARSFQWSPTDSLETPNDAKTGVNPSETTTYIMSMSDAKNCVYVDSTQVIIHQPPTADFSFRDTCVGLDYWFSNQSKIGGAAIDSLVWDLSNGTSFINNTPNFTPTDSSPVRLRLSVYDTYGCWDSTSQLITPFDVPRASFTINDLCQYDSIKATNTSTLSTGTLSYHWEVEGSDYYTNDLSAKIKTIGDVEVTLTAVSDKGCENIFIDTVTAFEKPVIQLKTTDNCLRKASDFDVEVSLTTSDVLESYAWYLNGNYLFNSQDDTSYTLTTEGRYGLEVRGVTNRGCLDTAFDSLSIHPIPVADFTIKNACLGDSIELNDISSVVTGSLAQRWWNVGKGYQSGAMLKKEKPTNYGLLPVSLIVQSDKSCFDTIQKDASVFYVEKPNLNVSGHCVGENIALAFTPIRIDSITAVEWMIDGQSQPQGLTANQIFTSEGQKNVELILTFNNGCTTDSMFTIEVDEKPTADFTWTLPCSDNQVEFESQSNTVMGTLVNHNWALGDGNSKSDLTFIHSYLTTGDYDVWLEVVNDLGCKDTMEKQITVDQIVTPDFEVYDVCVLDTQLIFENSLNRLDAISSITWKLGDGRGLSGSDSVRYAYQNPGTYTVVMDYETNPNCTYSSQKTITVHPLPTAGFTISPERADIVNSTVNFTSTSIDAVQHEYSFSNGFITDQINFDYDFLDTGTFQIEQQVWSQRGCTDIFTGEITIDFVVHILIPNAFHPNNDNINNTFSPQGLGIGTYSLSIYNRWGEKIYFTDKGEPWDGEEAIPGAYYYMITVYDYQQKPHSFSGVVHLIK